MTAEATDLLFEAFIDGAKVAPTPMVKCVHASGLDIPVGMADPRYPADLEANTVEVDLVPLHDQEVMIGKCEDCGQRYLYYPTDTEWEVWR